MCNKVLANSKTLTTAHTLVEELLAEENESEAMQVVEASLMVVSEAIDEDPDRDQWAEKLKMFQTL